MQEELYFYRKYGTNSFEKSATEKTIIPVRQKSSFFPYTIIFDNKKKLWQQVDDLPVQSNLGADVVYADFVEFPVRPLKPIITGKEILSKDKIIYLEDLSPKEMQLYLNYRRELKRFDFNITNFTDADEIQKDYFASKITVDYDNLTLKLSFTCFVRKEIEAANHRNLFVEAKTFPFYSDALPEMPVIKTETLCFDIKNGVFSSTRSEDDIPWTGEEEPWNDFVFAHTEEVLPPYLYYQKVIAFLRTLDNTMYPQSVISEAYEKCILLVERYTGTKIERALNTKNTKETHLTKMYNLTMLPYEHALYQVLMSKELYELKIRFAYKRTDSKVFHKFLEKAHIKDWRILRRCYMERPAVLLTCMRMQDSGFKDVNLYNRVLESEDNCAILDDMDRKSLVFFSRYSIRRRGQIATLNTLLKKTYDEDGDVDLYIKKDSVNMFCQYFRYVPKELRSDILDEGFTRFNHDALSSISYRARSRKIVFKYTSEQKKLEDDIEGYSFRLPKDSYQLSEIGAKLHNCVGSYAKDVKNKECTIVYATKDDAYTICIEVQQKAVKQELTNYNKHPTEEEKKVLATWHDRHGLDVL
ncbi:MAG: PcfJ domain-containing protein [Treponema sp.]|nr:PcfJ domain-containing protein [Treponema sp.]